MRSRLFVIAGLCTLFATVVVLNACKHQPGTTPDGGSGFPDAVAKILVNKCATAGCHNALSYQNSDGVLLDTWQHLFDGGSSGAIVVPYDVENSSLLSFINTDSTAGLVQEPHMPLYQTPLSKAEYNTIRDWIAAGAPDKGGNIPFGDNADTRQKVYLTAQGCDLIHVIDAKRNVIMRNIAVGKEPGRIEAPHCVRVSEDGKYAYTCSYLGSWMQKIDTRTDKVVGEVQLTATSGESQFNILNVSRDGTKVMITDLAKDNLLIVNTATMQVTQRIIGAVAGAIAKPHGIAANAAFDTLYITSQYGNTIYKLSPAGYLKAISLDGNPPANTPGTRDPHEIMLTPGEDKYFVTCQTSNEVRIMDAHADTLIAAIPVPKFPQELAISRTQPYMFVTCMEGASTKGPYNRGVVVVINYNTLQVVKVISDGDFWQPHGITVDDMNGKIFIASANISNGPPPHHVSVCGGSIGWYSVYDLNTLQPLDSRRYETSVYPYSADVRFKQ